MAESHREEIAKLEALYASNPGGRVFVHLAEAYRKGGEHERARRILDEGLARHTDSASGYVVLGRVLADMQIADEAETAFRRVLELDSGNLVALRWLGDLARQSGRFADAAIYYRDLLARNPSNEEVRDLVEIVEREAASSAPAAAQPEEEAETVAEATESPDTGEPTEAVEEPAPMEPAAHTASESAHAAEVAPAAEAEAARAETGALSGAEAIAPMEGPVGAGVPAAEAAEPVAPVHEFAAPDAATGEAAAGPDAITAAPDMAAQETVAHGAAEPAVPEAVEVEPEAETTAVPASEPAETTIEPEPLAPEPYLPEFAAAPIIPDEEPVFAPFVEPLVEEEPEPIPAADLGAEWPAEEESDEVAEPFEIQLFDSSIEAEEEEEVATFEGGIDLSDLAEASGDELEGEYADDEFLADFMKSTGDTLDDTFDGDSLDVLDTATPITLLGDETSADTAAAEASEEPFTFDLGAQDAGTGAESDELEFIEVVDLEESAENAAEFAFTPGELTGLDAGDDEEPIELVETFEVFELDEPDVTSTPAAEPGPWSEPARAAAPEPRPAPAQPPVRAEAAPMTETMALLYRSQGFHDRAAEVYRALLAQRPGDERLAARLREAEEAAGITPGAAEHADDETGEVWLRGVGAAWPDDSPEPTDATPYAWTETPDEASRAEPISSFLQELVSWKQGQSRWFETAIMGLDEESEIDAQPASAGWSPTAASAPASQPADPWLSTGTPSAGTWDPAQEIGLEADLTPAEPAPAPGGTADPWEQTGSATPASAAGPASAKPSPTDSTTDEAEDEDVEMFRSWLQSLKK